VTDNLPDIFARYAGALTDLVAEATTALGNDPNAGVSQDARVRSWLTETRRYLDPGFWAQAREAHAARLRAAVVEREAAAERERARRIGHARSDADSAARGLVADHPTPSFPKPKH
jgi:hypothetical protein